jgi:hypothetical protein
MSGAISEVISMRHWDSQAVGRKNSRCCQAWPRPKGPVSRNSICVAPCAQRALHEKGLQAFWRQSERQRLVEVTGDIALLQQREAEQHVFGDRSRREPAADGFECGAAGYAVRSAAKGGIPAVPAGHDGFEKEALIIGQCFAQREILLQRIMVVETVRHLDDANGGIVEKAHGSTKERPLRHEIGVEYGHERRVRHLQRMIDVAGLGMEIVGPCDVAGALGLAEIPEPGSPPIIGNPHIQIGPIQRQCAEDGLFQHLDRFVVGGDDQVHRWPVFGVTQRQPRFASIGFGAAVGALQQRGEQDGGIEQAEQFDGEAGEREAKANPGRIPRDGGGEAPVEIDTHHERHTGNNGGAGGGPIEPEQRCQQQARCGEQQRGCHQQGRRRIEIGQDILPARKADFGEAAHIAAARQALWRRQRHQHGKRARILVGISRQHCSVPARRRAHGRGNPALQPVLTADQPHLYGRTGQHRLHAAFRQRHLDIAAAAVGQFEQT